jgi:UDP-N-acetylenolpyruvoylglucosamine reductase
MRLRRTKLALLATAGALLATAGALLLSAGGCVMHNAACYNACSEDHRHCVTHSQTSHELEECDEQMNHCRRRCR